jgi:hypothetical protein
MGIRDLAASVNMSRDHLRMLGESNRVIEKDMTV